MTPDAPLPVVLVTGGNRGIGWEIAKQLAGRGYHAVVGCRDQAKGEAAVAALRAASGAASFLSLDVSRSDSVRAAARDLAAISDRLDVLVNNAGIYPDAGTDILTVGREQMVETFQSNTFGPLEVTQAFLPYLRKAAAPRVVNVASGYASMS